MAKNRFISYELKGRGSNLKYKTRQRNTLLAVAESLSGFSEEAVTGFGKYHQGMSEQLKERIKEIILSQRFSAPPLKESTIKKKKTTSNYSPSYIYLEKGFLVQNIEVVVGTKGLAYIGKGARTRVLYWHLAPNNNKHPNSKKTYQEIANIMEYGAPKNNQVPRPFWSTTVTDELNKMVASTKVSFSKAGVLYVNRLDKK